MTSLTTRSSAIFVTTGAFAVLWTKLHVDFVNKASMLVLPTEL